ncbi:hypothetical protein GJ496_001753 [Pomphorhynchus laevis]|nr:hypothetical protein GJ496_001753 [Pomphorhynchus laevis]
MSMWMNGDIPELYKEAKYLQNRITSRLHYPQNQNIIVKNFTKLVVSRKLSALRQFSSSRGSRASILDLDNKIENVSVFQKLISLHPAPAEVADQHVLSKPVTGYQDHHALVPEIIGIPNIDMELRSIICLPLILGRMGVCDPSTEPKTEFDRSQRMASPIINANESISQKIHCNGDP